LTCVQRTKYSLEEKQTVRT